MKSEEIKVTILMSAYNTEKYIHKAIDSVLNLTHKNIQLIIINDCSTDSTESIIQSYKDDRILYVKTPENLGCGGARKYGLLFATGEYIGFLDSDDWYEPETIEQLLNACISYNILSAHCNTRFVIEDTSETGILQNDLSDRLFDGEERFILGMRFTRLVQVHNGIYHKSLFNNIEYSDLRNYDDYHTGMELLISCNRVATISYIGYNYLLRSTSVSHSSSGELRAVWALVMWFKIKEWEEKVSHTNYADRLIESAIKNLGLIYKPRHYKRIDPILLLFPTLAGMICRYLYEKLNT